MLMNFCSGKNLVFDGFPKTGQEASYLADFLEKEGDKEVTTFFINVDRKVLLDRLAKRLVCPDCSYVSLNPNTQNILGNYCPSCHVKLIHRDDDKGQKMNFRIERYLTEKDLIIDEFRKISKVYIIDASRTLAETISDIVEIIDNGSKDPYSVEAERGARMCQVPLF